MRLPLSLTLNRHRPEASCQRRDLTRVDLVALGLAAPHDQPVVDHLRLDDGPLLVGEPRTLDVLPPVQLHGLPSLAFLLVVMFAARLFGRYSFQIRSDSVIIRR